MTTILLKWLKWPHIPRVNFNRELINLILWVLMFLLFPGAIRLFDSSAAPFDAGVLSAIILASLAVFFFQFLTWWIIRTIWPVMAEYSEFGFEQTFNQLLPWQRLLIFLSFYLLLLFAFVFTLAALV
ncbi:hypothetical protein [Desertivirga xinjiangensis]|uniref:hypothetical protein n=1 Tax=Desertivirga xinjiangensis TaxID=539206 RepID=UPI00210EE75C|nr:hypothetical protein [Pedobacter xinjiangensis]